MSLIKGTLKIAELYPCRQVGIRGTDCMVAPFYSRESHITQSIPKALALLPQPLLNTSLLSRARERSFFLEKLKSLNYKMHLHELKELQEFSCYHYKRKRADFSNLYFKNKEHFLGSTSRQICKDLLCLCGHPSKAARTSASRCYHIPCN